MLADTAAPSAVIQQPETDSACSLAALETYLHCNLMPKKPEKKLTGIPKIPHPHRSALVSEPSDF
jgi:hypothetical protein